jgi:hypothetical protein
MKGSWKTTAMGIAGILGIIAGVAKALLDNDPSTNPDWTMVLSGLTAGLTGLFARDNNKSSEAVGAQ